MQSIRLENERRARKKDDFEGAVIDTINSQINSINVNDFIDTVDWVFYKKFNEDTHSFTHIGKMACSFGLYSGYTLGKYAFRRSSYDDIYTQLRENTITIKDALLTILDSFIGQTDKNSVKYKILKSFFGFDAKDDNEARDIVKYSIQALAYPNDLELTTYQC